MLDDDLSNKYIRKIKVLFALYKNPDTRNELNSKLKNLLDDLETDIISDYNHNLAWDE